MKKWHGCYDRTLNNMQDSNLIKTTFVLSAVAGFCDTVTFIAGDSIFSAHVTGNFIVFANQLILGADANAWFKMVTFPVFILAVMVGGWLSKIMQNGNKLLVAEAILLTAAAVMAIGAKILNAPEIVTGISVMIIVFALGLQNAYGKLFSGKTFGPTTVMTGNVTQAALDLRILLIFGKSNNDAILSLKKQGILISGFFAGCIFGAICGSRFGISAIILAGLTILICYLLYGNKTTKMV